jgi:glucosamine-6-phosphate deaminase
MFIGDDGRQHVVRVDDEAELARVAADEVAEVVGRIEAPTVVFATGTTPLGLFAELRARVLAGDIDLTRIRAVQLDEYVGLEPGDRRCLWEWLRRELLRPAGLDEAAAIRFELGLPVERACAEVDRRLHEVGGIDLAVLGLGPNGHVGFNEPPSPPNSPTRRVRLDETSVTANARYWGSREVVPVEAVTLGMAALIAARRVVLLAKGSHKREILERTLLGEPSADVPASLLRTGGRLVVIAERAALP